MHKFLAISILGTGLSAAVLMTFVVQLFSPPIENMLKLGTAASALAFVIFGVSSLVLRRRIDGKRE